MEAAELLPWLAGAYFLGYMIGYERGRRSKGLRLVKRHRWPFVGCLCGLLCASLSPPAEAGALGPALLYSTLQAADEATTRRALVQGASEQNPLAQGAGQRLALKAASAAALTLVDVKLQHRSRKAAWVFRGAVVLGYGAITLHNARQRP